MGLTGQIWANGAYVSHDTLAPTNYKNSIHRTSLGTLVRKQFKKSIIFRVRRGNNYYGAKQDELYQDKYTYYVPGSINNTEGQAARNLLITAVGNWQSVLTDEEKSSYNKRASHGLHMAGYNLYIKEYILTNY